MAKNQIQEAIDNTVQTEIVTQNTDIVLSANILSLMVQQGDLIPRWWSQARDVALSKFWKSSDALSGAVYAMEAKISTIPMRVIARDNSIKSNVTLAEDYTEYLLEAADFGKGWVSFCSKFVESLCTQDNGAFVEIIGKGNPAGPIEGLPITVANLDAQRCSRTGNPQYPVVYTDRTGKKYKLHFSRVMFFSQMESTLEDMYGVGFCAISRCVAASQNLIDIATYKQEMMGSRPTREIIITQGGLDPTDVQRAVVEANIQMDNAGLSRFAKTIVMGSRYIKEAKLERVPLTQLPTGFDELESTNLGMALIALAFGMDVKEIFPLVGNGSSKADSIMQHIKQRGKGPGQILQILETGFNQKVLPNTLRISFDYQDDTQDRQESEIQSARAISRQRNLEDGATTIRVERERMVEHHEITQAQFEQMELEDGRLEDGLSVLVLFHSTDPDFIEFLSGLDGEFEQVVKEVESEENPDEEIEDDMPMQPNTNTRQIQANPLKKKAEKRIEEIMAVIMSANSPRKIKKARQAIAAIQTKFGIDKYYKDYSSQLNNGKSPDSSNSANGTPIDDSYESERYSTVRKRPITHEADTENQQFRDED